MTKIKINRLPEGFEIREGKVVKSEMRSGGPTGGHVTGDQVGYGLVTVPKSIKDVYYNNDDTVDVRFSLSSVPREKATIEAEGGETVLTDLDNDGKFGLYNISGPRHSAGGVPMNLPPQSFIYSDTKDMKFKKNELLDFGLKSKKGMTPAKISNKFDLNQYYGAMKDDFVDDIQLKSAELMLDKNTLGLSKLAFAQEAKKKFENGVPLAAHLYVQSMGQDPIEFSEKINQMVVPKAQYGMELDYAQDGAETMDWMQEIPYDLQEAQEGEETSETKTVSQSENPPKLSASDYEALEKFFKSDTPETKDYIDKLYKFFVDNAKSKELKNIPAKKDMIDEFLNYQKNNYTVAELLPIDKRVNPLLDQGAGPLKNKNTQSLFDELSKTYPDKYKGYNIDSEKFKFNQAFFSALDMTNKIDKNSPLEIIKEGPVEATNIGENKNVSKPDGAYGNNSLNQFVRVKQKATETAESPTSTTTSTTTSKNGCPCKNNEGSYTGSYSPSCCSKPGEYKPNYNAPGYEFWLQDQLKTNALAQRNRDMFMPWQPEVENQQSQYVLEDPTREIAANMEAYNIATNAAGTFGGPQSLGARIAANSGQAFNAIANTLASVNSRNVGTVNNGLRYNAQLEAQTEAERRNRQVKEYDDTQLTLQKYMDEKNYDREQYANALSNMYTNAANTYDLNTINPYYNIDPSTGGTIEMTNTKGPFQASQQYTDPQASKESILQDIQELKNRGINNPTPALLEYLRGNKTVQQDPMMDYIKQMQDQYQFPYGEQPVQGKRGREVKPFMFPFYIGDMGF